MAEDTGISWAHNTQNFWVGCDKCAPECTPDGSWTPEEAL
jgi:hypothetical protein